MRSIRKIIVTGDILRVGTNGHESQNVNIRWLLNLIRPALGMITDLRVQALLHERNPGNLAYEIYGANGLDMCLRNWVGLYERSPSTDELTRIGETFDNSLVLSFELPEMMRSGLALLGIPYIDLTIHPVRFLDDLAFGVRSNVPGLAQALAAWVLTENEIQLGAGLAMATLARIPPLASCAGAADWALFACQTGDDKVLIRNGTLMQASDFLDALTTIADRHERILVKTHPAAGISPSKLLKRLIPNMVDVDANFYHLLVQDGISDVYSITSSTSIEARYFGKAGTHLAHYPYVFSEDRLSDVEYLQVRAALHLPQFWAPLLERAGVSCRNAPRIDATLWPHRMRRSLRNAWGADIFMGNP